MSDDPIIEDTSRVDSYLRSRHRVEVLNSAWKPALAGAAGAAAIIGAVVVGVWVATPRFTYREIEVPRVTYRDVTVPNIVTKDVEIDIPRIVPRDIEPRKVAPPLSDAPRTSEERRFVERPEYRSAQFKGRLVADPDGQIRFDTGRTFYPAIGDTMEWDHNALYLTEPFWGDWGYCNSIPNSANRFDCWALHDGVIVDLSTTYRRKEPPQGQVPIVTKRVRAA